MTNRKLYPHNIIEQVKEACGRMMELLAQENGALQSKQMERIEPLTKEKAILSQQIEGLLAEVKGWAEYASDEAKTELKNHTRAVDSMMTEMNVLAQKNLALLEANHTATRTFLDVVRQAVSKGTPKAETYGKQGKIEEDKSSQSLMTRSV